MLDIKWIRENRDLIAKTAKWKKSSFCVDELIEVDVKRRELSSRVDILKSQQKEGNTKIRSLPACEKEAHLEKMKEISETIKNLEEDLRVVKEKFNELMLLVPNPVDETVPEGYGDADDVEVSSWGEIPEFDFELKSHVDLGKSLDIIDIERGVKISGSRFYFLKNEGCLLELALMRYALDFLVKKGFTPMTVPVLVKDIAMTGTGYFPGGEEQAYKMKEDDLYLVGTSEVPLASYYYDEILNMDQFPVMVTAWSNCFRREAGTYGKDTQGLYRIHQFQKVEQVYILENDNEKSRQAHDFLLNNAREFLQSLNIPHKINIVCSGEMGQGQVKKYDINSWMPSRNAYCETHSCSMFYEFQARRLKLRYKDSEGNIQYCHTLNNTLIASPRILIPLLELNQTREGTVKIPEVLHPYMCGVREILPKKR